MTETPQLSQAATSTNNIVLSPQQEAAYDKVGAWLRDRDKPCFKLHGLAGTGKSTIADKIAQQHNGPKYFMTYTGRASQVLRKKGVPCKTIHSYVYLPQSEKEEEARKYETELKDLEALEPAETKTEQHRRESTIRKIKAILADLYQPDFVKRPVSPFDPRGLIVCDEMSMVGRNEAEDLLSYGLPVLVLGDPGQLPPVKGRGYFNEDPDVVLTEIHRQARDNPIIQLAMMAREGRNIPKGKYGESSVISKTQITEKLSLSVDQFAVGKNATRASFNNELRKLRGFEGPFPKAGERLMCLRNNAKHPINNGEIFETTADADASGRFVHLELKDEDGHEFSLECHPECFTDPEALKHWSYNRRKMADEFDFCYASTIHKLQGGQFGSVLVYPDLFTWSGAREDYKKLVYTGLTRAVDWVTLAL
jgi:exodeoxyribonuclease-5